MGLLFRATETFAQRQTRAVDDANSDRPVHVTTGFSAYRCVVDVDVELGLVKVVQMDLAMDIGTVVHPVQARGQVEGGTVQGMGFGAMEDLKAEGGHLRNPNWRTYHIPTIVDAPRINAEFVCHPEPGYFYGWKGIGELPHVNAPVAVVAAIRNATGLDLPMTPATAEYIAQSLDDGSTLRLGEIGARSPHGPWGVRDGIEPSVGPWAKSRTGPG